MNEISTTPRYKLLFVDDDEFFLNLYSQKARRYNIEMKVADSAQAALEKLQNGFSPDVFVIDLDMPTVSGFELIEKLQKDHLADAAHIVVLTNKNDPYYIEKSRQYHVDRYIVKATRVPSEVMDEIFDLLEHPPKNK